METIIAIILTILSGKYIFRILQMLIILLLQVISLFIDLRSKESRRNCDFSSKIDKITDLILQLKD